MVFEAIEYCATNFGPNSVSSEKDYFVFDLDRSWVKYELATMARFRFRDERQAMNFALKFGVTFRRSFC